MNFKQQLAAFFRGELKRHEVIFLGQTPPILLEHGMSNLGIFISQATLKKVYRPQDSVATGHGISRQILKTVKEQIENPLMILKGNSNKSFVIVTEKIDCNKRPVVVAIHSDVDFVFEKRNEIKSIHGRNDFDCYIKREIEKGNLLYKKS